LGIINFLKDISVS